MVSSEHMVAVLKSRSALSRTVDIFPTRCLMDSTRN
jgi:hypothetical protein